MKTVILIFIVLFSSSLLAEENENITNTTASDGAHPAIQLIAYEGLFAFLSVIGAKYHDSYAKTFIFTLPWAAAESFHDKSDALLYTSMVSAEALALYVISLDENKYNETERFQKNMIAWHVVAGITGTVYWLTSDNKKQNVAISFAPVDDGGTVDIKLSF